MAKKYSDCRIIDGFAYCLLNGHKAPNGKRYKIKLYGRKRS